MRRRQTWLVILALVAVAGWWTATARADDKPTDATGTYKSSFTTQGGQTIETTYKLKQKGTKITGTVTGRDGKEIKIENGKAEDGEVSFDVTRERDGQKFTMHYHGKLSAEAITGKIDFKRGEQTRSFDWKATRQKSEK